jgi:hypothetical protein
MSINRLSNYAFLAQASYSNFKVSYDSGEIAAKIRHLIPVKI